jgi:ATP-dependent RNA helicase DDX35
LVVVPISHSSANQRTGRAGRLKNGKCYRLYTEDDYHKLKQKNIPEMQRYIFINYGIIIRAGR